LRRQREQRGWSQAELATKLGTNLKTVSRWERGMAKPSPLYRQQLDKLFDENRERPDTDKSTLPTKQKGREKATRDFSSSIFLMNEQLPTPQELYGRRRERSELLSYILREGSVSIVGPPHIGKTWLIEYLRQVLPNNLEGVRLGYLDAALPACDTITGFVNEALQVLGYRFHAENSSPDLALLEKYVRSLQEELLVVLCIDHFDALTQHKDFNRRFFTSLRAMAQESLCLVAASEERLIELVSKSTHSSPFFNIFNQVNLGPFDREEASEFVTDKGQQAGFTIDEQECLLKYAQDRRKQWPPLRLQLAGKLLLKAKRSGNIDLSPENSAYWHDFRKQLNKQYRQMVK
jgi:transcriptional regulator with XRE-family HTH domain